MTRRNTRPRPNPPNEASVMSQGGDCRRHVRHGGFSDAPRRLLPRYRITPRCLIPRDYPDDDDDDDDDAGGGGGCERARNWPRPRLPRPYQSRGPRSAALSIDRSIAPPPPLFHVETKTRHPRDPLARYESI